MAKRGEVICEPPFLKRAWLDRDRVRDFDRYPFCLPIIKDKEFDINFDRPITILVGENGSGKSTILEGIAGLAGYDEAGGSGIPSFHETATSLSIALDRCITSAKRCMRGRSLTSGMLGMSS